MSIDVHREDLLELIEARLVEIRSLLKNGTGLHERCCLEEDQAFLKQLKRAMGG